MGLCVDSHPKLLLVDSKMSLQLCTLREDVAQIMMTSKTAFFSGRVKVFQKCTAGVASSKGRQNLESVRLTV